MVPIYMVCMVPLVVRERTMPLYLARFAWFPDQAEEMDLFLAAKQAAVTACAAVMAVMMAIYAVRRQIAASQLRVLALPAVAAVLTLASSVCSANADIAFSGVTGNYEGAWVAMSYAMIMAYGYIVMKNAPDSGRAREGVYAALAVSMGLVGLVGTLQALGHDPLCTRLAAALVLSGDVPGRTISPLTLKAYATLYNPNYLGVACVMTIPLMAAKAACADALPARAGYGLSCVLMFMALLGSGSKSGIVVFAVCMGALVFMAKYRKRVRPAYAVLLALCAAVGMIAAAALLDRPEGGQDTVIDVLRTGDADVKFESGGRTAVMTLDIYGSSMADIVSVRDSDGTPYKMECDEDEVLHFGDGVFPGLSVTAVQYGDYISIDLREETQVEDTRHWYFTNQTEDGSYKYVTVFGKPDAADSDAVRVFEPLRGRERMISGRGYIWSRTIPLLADHILLGSGQDCFVAEFPNGDYLGKAAHGYEDVLVTRPHNMYLQTGVQSGIVALLCVLVFLMRLMRRLGAGRGGLQTAALFSSLLGYMLMGLTNDSSLTTTPVFCVLVAAALSTVTKPQPAPDSRPNTT